MPYPDLLAGGTTIEGSQYPFELFAGEAPPVTGQGTAGAAIRQFEVIAMDEAGLLLPWNPDTGTARLVGTFTGASVNTETVTINGQVLTFRSVATLPTDVVVAGSTTVNATNLAAAINLNPGTTRVRAVASGSTVTVYSLEPGEGGNTVTVAETMTNFAWAGGATNLGGGLDTREARPMGIAAQPIPSGMDGPYFSAGYFAHDALLWPASVDTLVKRKMVFSRTDIKIGKILGVATRIVYP